MYILYRILLCLRGSHTASLSGVKDTIKYYSCEGMYTLFTIDRDRFQFPSHHTHRSPSSQSNETRCLTLTLHICVYTLHSRQKGQVSNRSCEPRAVKISVEVKKARHAVASLLLLLTIESSVVNFSIIQIQCYHLDRSGDEATVIFLSDGTYYYTVQCHRRVRRVYIILYTQQRCVYRIYRR